MSNYKKQCRKIRTETGMRQSTEQELSRNAKKDGDDNNNNNNNNNT
jgi:hypothetical protein